MNPSSPIVKTSRGEEINKCYTCPKQLQVKLVSAELNVSKTIHISPVRGRTPQTPQQTTKAASARSVSPSIDREAAREFIRKQQEQRKAMEAARKSQNERELIKERLAALQKRTRNLVQHNVERKKATKKQSPLKKIPQNVNKTPPKVMAPPARVPKKVDKENFHAKRVGLEEKLLRSPSGKSESLQKMARKVDAGFLQPTDLLKSNQSLGLLRKGEALLKDDIYSPLKIHDATGVNESTGRSMDFGRPSTNNQTYGDLTLDPNATSFIIHENSQEHEKTLGDKQKTFIKSPEKKKEREIPEWLQETNVQQYPYNFITALKKKLSAAMKEIQSPVEPAKETANVEKYHKMGLVNDKRDYESCSFTECLSESLQLGPDMKQDKRDWQRRQEKDNINTSVTSISSPVASKYEENEDTDCVITISDPNTVSEVTSLKSETPEVVIRPSDVTPEMNPVPFYNEFNEVREKMNKYLLPSTSKNPNLVEKSMVKEDKTREKQRISFESDNLNKTSNENKENVTSDRQQMYEKLLLEFKQSLNNFIELNQQLHEAVKNQKRDIAKRKEEEESKPMPLFDVPKAITPQKLSPQAEIQLEPVTPTKYSSSFDSQIISNGKISIERQNSTSSSSTTTSNGTTSTHDHSQDNRKSDFYEPQRFEREFERAVSPPPMSSDNVVEEIISHESQLTSSKSVPIIREHRDKAKALSPYKNIDSGTSSLKEDSGSMTLPTLQSSEKQSTSAGNDESSVPTTLSYHPDPKKVPEDERTDTEIESLPTDGRYESEFERESESAVESSIMEMSANESNLNFSYSTVGMVDQLIYSQEMKGEQLTAIIESKAKSMIDRLKGQISFLEVKKQRCKGDGAVEEKKSIRKKQRAILMKLHEARKILKKIVESESHQKVLKQKTTNTKYQNLFEKILKSRMKGPNSSLEKSQPIKGFEIEPSLVLERLLKKRQAELEARKKKLEELHQWQAQLDAEERRVMQMEEKLLQQNIAEAQEAARNNVKSPKSVSSREESIKKSPFKQISSDEEDSRIAKRLNNIEKSLSLLEDVQDEDDDVVLTGYKLNKLWYRLSGRKEKKFEPETIYHLDKKRVAELYEEAKNVVLSQFEDKNRVKQMLEMSKMQESCVESALELSPHESPKAGSSTTEASSVLDKDPDEIDVPEKVFSPLEVSNVTLTEENLPKIESEIRESVEEAPNTPIMSEIEQNVQEIESVEEAEKEVEYSDTFNHSEEIAENVDPDETQYLENISFPKIDMTNNDETFIEKSFENDRHDSSQEVPEELTNGTLDSSKDKKSDSIPEEVLAVACHSATSSSSSSISSKVDTESDEMLIMAAISTITVTPKMSSSPVEYKLPDIINEAEVLRRQQMQIEQEIEQLQQQVPFVYLKNIPNKPPPPYTLPPQESSKNKFPSTTKLSMLVTKRVENLYRLNQKSSNIIALEEDDTLNIYERLIIDVSDEFFYTFERHPKQNGIMKNSLIFYNPPDELQCLQNFISNKVEKICEPLTRDDSLALSSLEDFAPLNAYYSGRRTHKKDLVDEILMQELIEDDPNWTYFEEEETVVKNDLINGILKMIVDEAVTELLQIIT
ncbi:uncharacterized protein LOC134835556 [Culicoides brevitarsis]|uniref:uncharacterized protein LOC134835556 n=1 Tax=Culicoides brevitarsis TaxID=469753 RepID=UPI00307C313F